ncbi:hypothetical protein HK102_012149 [Quaeritorhiza haematococci]|nr:hypothetical protein HK102_012149 [Quaeritorhiza haematococci]
MQDEVSTLTYEITPTCFPEDAPCFNAQPTSAPTLETGEDVNPLGTGDNAPIITETVPTNMMMPTVGLEQSTNVRPTDHTPIIVGSVCGMIAFAFVGLLWVRRSKRVHLRDRKQPPTRNEPNFPGGVAAGMTDMTTYSTTPEGTSKGALGFAAIVSKKFRKASPSPSKLDLNIDISIDNGVQQSTNSPTETDGFLNSDSFHFEKFVGVDSSHEAALGAPDTCNVDSTSTPELEIVIDDCLPRAADLTTANSSQINNPANYQSFALDPPSTNENLSSSTSHGLGPTASSSTSSLPPEDSSRPHQRSATQASSLSQKTAFSFTPSVGEAPPPNLPEQNRTVLISTPWAGIRRSGELAVESGDMVEIIRRYQSGWAWGRNLKTEEYGMFPVDRVSDRDSVNSVVVAARKAVAALAETFDGGSFLKAKREEEMQEQARQEQPPAGGRKVMGAVSALRGGHGKHNKHNGGAEPNRQHLPRFDQEKLKFRLWSQPNIEPRAAPSQ